jgi:ligand-binding sensor protein
LVEKPHTDQPKLDSILAHSVERESNKSLGYHRAIDSKSFSIPVVVRNLLPGTIIRGTLKTSNSQLVTPISIKLQRPDECD